MLAHSRYQGMNPTNPRWPSVFVGVIAVTLFLALLYAPQCLAGKNAGGALIVHTQDAYNFSAGTVCTTTYGTPASCEEANTRSDKDVGTVVWLLAAFPDTSNPAVSGIYFGIDYDDSLYVDEWNMCAPDGSQELPDSGWPDEGRGNTIAYPAPIEGNRLFPFYSFKIEGGTDGSYFSAGINPTGGYATFIDGGFPPVTDHVTLFGTLRWYTAGVNPCPGVAAVEDEERREATDLRLIVMQTPGCNPKILFTLSEGGHVTLEIYGVAGGHVCTLIDQDLGQGRHQRDWNGKDELGRNLPTGVYFARLVVAGQSEKSARLVLVD